VGVARLTRIPPPTCARTILARSIPARSILAAGIVEQRR
jgi:hypothetical protein